MAATINPILNRRVGVILHKNINQSSHASSRSSIYKMPNRPTNVFLFKFPNTLQFSTLSSRTDSAVNPLTTTHASWGTTNLSKLVIPERLFHSNNPQKASNSNDHRSLKLMDFPEIIWPSIINTIKNWILSKVIIRPYLDAEFDLQEFAKGAKQAFLLVTSILMQGKLDELKEFVTKEALEEIKRNFSVLGMQQRKQFEICSEDIYFHYPYQVGIMLNDSSDSQKRFVEITMCFHCILGSEQLKVDDPTMRELFKHKDKIIVCNCRFIKEYTKGHESDWTINVLNYFHPAVN